MHVFSLFISRESSEEIQFLHILFSHESPSFLLMVWTMKRSINGGAFTKCTEKCHQHRHRIAHLPATGPTQQSNFLKTIGADRYCLYRFDHYFPTFNTSLHFPAMRERNARQHWAIHLHIFLIVTASFVILAPHSVLLILCTFTLSHIPRFAVRCCCLRACPARRAT